MFASASGDGAVRVWDSTTFKQIKTLGSRGFDIEAVAFSGDSHSLAAGDDTGTITIWSLKDGQEVKTFKQDCGVTTLSFQSEKGRVITSGCKSILAWDIATGAFSEVAPRNGFVAVALDSTGDNVLSSAIEAHQHSRVELRKPGSMQAPQSVKTVETITAIAFGPTDDSFATGGNGGKIGIWSIGGKVPRNTGNFQIDPLNFGADGNTMVNSIAFSPRGKLIAAGYGSDTKNAGGVAVWNIDSGVLVADPSPGPHVRPPWDPKNANMGSGDRILKPQPTDYSRNFNAKDVTVKARILSKPEPQYTERARLHGVQGTLVLKAVLNSSGEVTNISCVSRLPYGLNEKSIFAAKGIKFTPAQKDGHAVSQWILIEYNYSLF